MSSYTIDSVDSGMNALNALISVMCDITFDLAEGETDKRVDALLWVARDVSEGIVAFIDEPVAGRTEVSR